MMDVTTSTLLASAPLIVALVSTYVWYSGPSDRNPRRLPFAPGPKPLPLIGNIFQLPRSGASWAVFTEWKKTWGDIIHVKALNRHILILNSLESAKALLSNTIYADRPRLVMAGEMMGFGPSIAFIGYCARWRTYRRLTHHAMSKMAVNKYHPIQEKQVKQYLRTLLDAPEAFAEHLRLMLGKNIMAVIYGIDIDKTDHTYITVADETLANVSDAAVPGRFLVDIIPFLRHLPAWFPGAGFQRAAIQGQKQVKLMIDRPFEHTKRDMAAGIAPESFTSDLIQGQIRLEDDQDKDSIIKWASATMYGAAGETTFASLTTFILAMVLHPHVVKKAQAELDSVVGSGRLPTFADRPYLPYIEAVVMETMRWKPALPLGVAHRSMEDDEYKGFFIPAETIVLPNVWAISQDPLEYKAPTEFNPDRFLVKDGPIPTDPREYAFGFGRRICAGRHFADATLYIAIAAMLATFDISKEIDHATGLEIDPRVEYTTGFVSHAEPFNCRITPRSNASAVLTGC